MADEPVFIFLATYGTQADAELDYHAMKELHSGGVIGTHDPAVITRGADGKVKIHKPRTPCSASSSRRVSCSTSPSAALPVE